MILVLDIGNTSTFAGMYDNGEIVESFRMPSKDDKDYKISVNSDVVAVRLRHFLFSHQKAGRKIEGAAVCSVVPELTFIYKEMIDKFIDVDTWVLDHTADLGLKIDVDKPEQAGPDRLANAVAMKNIYGCPGLVIDLGTSTNFDVVDHRGNYIGGSIAPGVKTSSAELFKRASRLFAVDIAKPEKAIGRNTKQAIQSGIFFGSLGLIDHIAGLITEELKAVSSDEIRVVATGGYADLFAPHSKHIQTVDQMLTLKGIVMAYERNVS